MAIRFGTSGWRALISEEFTFDNVRLVAQAIADYLFHTGEAGKGIIVGYDTRFLSNQFARVCADVLSRNKIPTFLTNRDTPTPVISYHILKKKAGGAINITASHNPPEYNGIKFSPSYGGPAPPEVTGKIEKRIKELSAQNLKSKLRGNRSLKKDIGKIEVFDPRPDYLFQLKSIVNMKAIRKAGLNVVVDLMHGTSRGYLDELLRDANCRVQVLNGDLDPMFGGLSPEPARENIKDLVSKVRASKADLGLATDGDGDRFGIVDRDGTYILANQVISLLFVHLLETRPSLGKVARTLATTHLIDAIAEKRGIEVCETPVGFKYIGEILSRGDCVIGGEESGGLSIGGHLPEKDGILACLLMAEMVAMRKKSIGEMLKDLYKNFGRFYATRVDIYLPKASRDRLFKKLNSNPPERIAGIPVFHLNKKDGYKFILKDGSWAMFRPSGTEPAVRCYFEARSRHKLRRLIEAGRAIAKI